MCLSGGDIGHLELDSTGVILVFFVDMGFLGDVAFDFGFSSFFWLLFFFALSGLNPTSHHPLSSSPAHVCPPLLSSGCLKFYH